MLRPIRLVSAATVAGAFVLSCATSAPMTTYPGAKRSIRTIGRGNYELCETGRTDVNPHVLSGEQGDACAALARVDYASGSEGWVHYMELACRQRARGACGELVGVALNSAETERRRAGGDHSIGVADPSQVMPRAIRERVTAIGRDMCLRGGSDAGDACAATARLLRLDHPEDTITIEKLLDRGCNALHSSDACSGYEKLGKKADWESVHETAARRSEAEDREAERRAQERADERQHSAAGEDAAERARAQNQQQATDALRQSQESWKQQMNDIHGRASDAKNAQRERDEQRREAEKAAAAQGAQDQREREKLRAEQAKRDAEERARAEHEAREREQREREREEAQRRSRDEKKATDGTCGSCPPKTRCCQVSGGGGKIKWACIGGACPAI